MPMLQVAMMVFASRGISCWGLGLGADEFLELSSVYVPGAVVAAYTLPPVSRCLRLDT